uniref:Uncharacterized protein n=1 Tax=Angiostrongylus cantonensis TaxID=6313 RepID=A0A0K0DM87_ANGCA
MTKVGLADERSRAAAPAPVRSAGDRVPSALTVSTPIFVRTLEILARLWTISRSERSRPASALEVLVSQFREENKHD